MKFALRMIVVLLLALAGTANAGQICIVPSVRGWVGSAECDCLGCPIPTESARVGYATDGSPCWEGPCSQESFRYEYRISASDSDPNVNSGALPAGLNSLYLWLSCTTDEGFAAAEFDLVTFGDDLQHLSTTFLNGVLSAGTDTEILIAVGGCPEGEFLIAELVVMVMEEVSVESETWADVKELYR